MWNGKPLTTKPVKVIRSNTNWAWPHWLQLTKEWWFSFCSRWCVCNVTLWHVCSSLILFTHCPHYCYYPSWHYLANVLQPSLHDLKQIRFSRLKSCWTNTYLTAQLWNERLQFSYNFSKFLLSNGWFCDMLFAVGIFRFKVLNSIAWLGECE